MKISRVWCQIRISAPKAGLFAGRLSDLQQSVDDGVEIDVVLVRHCFCPLVEEGEGGFCCGFRSEGMEDDLLPRFEFAVTRTVIHFSIWGACGIVRVKRWGEQFRWAR